MLVAIDIDDTVLRHHPGKPVYESPKSVLENCRPILEACSRVEALIESGVEVHFITGRSGLVKAATVAQLRTWISAKVTAAHVHVQGAWAGYEALAVHKAERLRALGAVCMVGDHAADESAAIDAGVPFLHALRFAAGDPLPGLRSVPL